MTALSSNVTYQGRLGWTCDEIVPGTTSINAVFVDAVKALQIAVGFHGAEVDGVVGPSTYGALLLKKQAALVAGGKPPSLADAGVIAVYEMKRLWLKNIIDPKRGASDPQAKKSLAAIDAIVRSSDGSGWDWLPPYAGDGDVEWCLMAVAFAWRAAGLKMSIRKSFLPSTQRMQAFARYQPLENTPNPKPAIGPHRMMLELDEHSKPGPLVFPDGTPARAGDVLLVGGVGTGPGKHGVLVEAYNEKTGEFTTVEGNGGGFGPDGTFRQGMVRNRPGQASCRKVGLRPGEKSTTYFARKLIRFAPVDIVA